MCIFEASHNIKYYIGSTQQLSPQHQENWPSIPSLKSLFAVLTKYLHKIVQCMCCLVCNLQCFQRSWHFSHQILLVHNTSSLAIHSPISDPSSKQCGVKPNSKQLLIVTNPLTPAPMTQTLWSFWSMRYTHAYCNGLILSKIQYKLSPVRKAWMEKDRKNFVLRNR